ncbi:MAG: DUF1289 domain-containing protein [Gammaproteobacteria bacterium]|nr:DUF1289 domain-containing protein [Gammaproteobacteria bacterium]
MKKIRTPCIGICSTTSFGDLICRGCKRYAFEVINWNSYDDEQKLAVLSRVEKLNTQIIENKLRIVSVPSLRQGLKTSKVPFDETLSPYCWLHNLLKRRHKDLENLEDYGVYVRSEYKEMPLKDIFELIDREIMILCEAHFSRYIDDPS